MHITVKLDRAKLAAVRRALGPGLQSRLPAIMVSALHKTAKGTRTSLGKEIRARLAAKQRDVLNRIYYVIHASRASWRARLELSNRRLAVSAFRHSRVKGGVSYTITRGLRKRIAGAFVRAMKYADPSAHGGRETYDAIFRRVQPGDKPYARWAGRAGGRRRGRAPLIFLRGPSIGRAVENMPAILQRVERQGRERLAREVDGQVRRHVETAVPR